MWRTPRIHDECVIRVRLGYRRRSHDADEGGGNVIVLGIILALIGLLLSVPLLWVIGLVLVVVGAILWVAGAAGHEIGGRRHYY